MMKYIFISDFFENEVNGGAELTDANLRQLLDQPHEKRKSVQVFVHWLEKNKDARFVISNFINLGEPEKEYLTKNCNYIIWEHDHKYLKTRDPSVFENFLAPKDQLINVEFYKNAKAVVCQTKLHAEVVTKNLELTNVLNFGGSIWTNEQLDAIDGIRNSTEVMTGRDWKLCFSNSTNPVKGTKLALEYCEAKKQESGVEYEAIPACPWEEFVARLATNSTFVFFPQVLETCSRVCVEARMLNLKVVGNKNIGALSEDWFKQFKGKFLTDFFRQKNKLIPQFIDFAFSKREKKESKRTDVTVILNLYKRPQNLQKQIEAFENQTIKPKEIWIWQNYAAETDPLEFPVSAKDHIKWITSNHNWGIYGRFAMAQLAQTEFVCINDDDTIPGPKWLETCIESYYTNPGLQGGIGVVLTSDDYKNHFRIGWAEPKSTTVEVDLVGHSWFFPKKYLKYMWMEEPFTWNMEDAHFSYCLQKYGNTKTYVPPQDTKEKSSSILGYELGVDAVAMSNPANHNQFYSERDQAIKHYLNNGWKKVLR